MRAAKAGRIKEDDICPFCRTPTPFSDEEIIKRYKERVEMNDPEGMNSLSTEKLSECFSTELHQSNLRVIWERLGI